MEDIVKDEGKIRLVEVANDGDLPVPKMIIDQSHGESVLKKGLDDLANEEGLRDKDREWLVGWRDKFKDGEVDFEKIKAVFDRNDELGTKLQVVVFDTITQQALNDTAVIEQINTIERILTKRPQDTKDQVKHFFAKMSDEEKLNQVLSDYHLMRLIRIKSFERFWDITQKKQQKVPVDVVSNDWWHDCARLSEVASVIDENVGFIGRALNSGVPERGVYGSKIKAELGDDKIFDETTKNYTKAEGVIKNIYNATLARGDKRKD
jgi:hypothetical protein